MNRKPRPRNQYVVSAIEAILASDREPTIFLVPKSYKGTVESFAQSIRRKTGWRVGVELKAGKNARILYVRKHVKKQG